MLILPAVFVYAIIVSKVEPTETTLQMVVHFSIKGKALITCMNVKRNIPIANEEIVIF